jgi:hypothetical protein
MQRNGTKKTGAEAPVIAEIGGIVIIRTSG